MDKKVFILRDSTIRDRLKVYLDTLRLGPDENPLKVTIEPYKAKRSLAQQAIMWIWHKQWSDYTGDTTDAEHLRFKAVFLLPILIRDNVIPGLESILADAQKEAIDWDDTSRLNALYRLISTTLLNVGQFAEILEQYQTDAEEKGCFFTVKAPEYYEAMGIKK